MQRVEFAKDFSKLFEESGLKTFEDFFHYSDGDTININKKRDVVAFSIGEGENRRDFFMKRFHQPHFKDMTFTILNFGRLCSQAELEWRNANLLLQNGIETYRPVCCGAETQFAIEKRSFFITEKLTGQCLTDYVAQNWDNISDTKKQDIMKAIGRFVRKIHDAKISMPDLCAWHLFMTETDGNYEFAIIDLHRMKVRLFSRMEVIRNLAAFDFSMLEKYFDDELREVFLKSYIGPDFRGESMLKLGIKTRSRTLTRRRRAPVY
jgi:tRNA A-37 threonylcarbamoyl transferase component Bud32